jgi:hypothetical protein
MSSTAAANINALAAAAKGMSGAPLDAATTARRTSKPASQFRGPNLNTSPSMASSVPANDSASGPASYGVPAKAEAAVADGPPLVTMPDHEKGDSKSRTRRASEGSRLSKGDGKRTSGSELRCEKCGKGYKHSSCLTKHLSVALSPPPSHILSLLKTNALPFLHSPRTFVFGVIELTVYLVGSTRQNGSTHPNCSSPSINRCNFWRQPLSLSP